MNTRKFMSLTESPEKAVNFALARNLINDKKRCKRCKSRMKISKNSRLIDQVEWMCKNSKCKAKTSIRTGTFFERSKLDIADILQICFMWSKNLPLKYVAEDLNISTKTMIDWYRFCGDIVLFHYENAETSKIGGVNQIVEIDESVFSKRKYNRGRLVKETWVFGGINRNNSKEMFIEMVPNRTRETLLEVKK